jgi:hypothetical protein
VSGFGFQVKITHSSDSDTGNLKPDTSRVEQLVSGFSTEVNMKSYMDVEELEVYQKLCRLHIEVCDLSHTWHPKRSMKSARKFAALRIARVRNSLRKTTTVMSVTKLKA